MPPKNVSTNGRVLCCLAGVVLVSGIDIRALSCVENVTVVGFGCITPLAVRTCPSLLCKDCWRRSFGWSVTVWYGLICVSIRWALLCVVRKPGGWFNPFTCLPFGTGIIKSLAEEVVGSVAALATCIDMEI